MKEPRSNRRQEQKRGGDPANWRTRRQKSTTVGLALTVFLAVAVGAIGAWRWLPSLARVTTPSGTLLGRLAAGVSRSDLNLLVITLDTTRADRLGAYGFRDIQTPNLDRLAREGVLFEQAASAAPLTLPAHSSIFTGKFPPEHGVRDNGGFFLDPRETTLAKILKARGFRTGGFIGAYVLDSKWGINQGFDTYFDNFDLSKYKAISLGAIQRPGNEVVDRGLQWLDEAASSRFFCWLHMYDPHAPYDPPEPYKSLYAGRPYLGEIAFVDAQVGRVLGYLESHQLLDRTIVVIMGDHGESLGDHGEATHGFFVYESVTHIPLIIRAPFSATLGGRRVADVVRSVDVMPTVLEMLGVPPPKDIEGKSVAPLMTGAARELNLDTYTEAMYPLHHFGWSDLRAMRAGRFKLIAAPRPELYDLQDDPGEQHDLFARREALGTRMLAQLQEREKHFVKRDAPDKQTIEVDPDARARLAALGYVGTFVASAAPDDARTGLADPKDKIDVFNKITEAREMSKDDSAFQEVVDMLKGVVRQDPKVIDAWFMIGNTYAKAGHPHEAIAAFKQTLALKPDDEMAVINMANVYRELGQDEEALVGYQRFLELDPKNSQVRYEASEILIDRGDLDGAEKELRAALEIEPKLAAARNALGVVALKRGDLPGAEREIRQAIAEKPDVRLAHFNLALLAEERGQLQDGVSEYRKEIDGHQGSYKAWFNLGKLYARIGDRAAQVDAYRHAIEANPSFAEGHLYLAKLYLDTGQNLDEAVTLARKGIELGPNSEYAPLGYYVIADIYSRQGRHHDAEQEAARGRALEHARKVHG